MAKNEQLIVYKASAGTGKTYTLACRFVALLLRDETPDLKSILAVTFTNKATTEMKDRIIEFLYNIANHPEASANEIEKTNEFIVKAHRKALSATEMQDRADKALKYLVHHYEEFKVSTIDSFLQVLLSGAAKELGLSANFKVEIGDNDVIEQAIDNLMRQLPERNSEDPVFTKIKDFCVSQIGEQKNWDISRELKNLARELFNEPYLENEQGITAALGKDWLKNYKEALKNGSYEFERCLTEAEDCLQVIEKDFLRNGKYFEELSRGPIITNQLINNVKGLVEKEKIPEKQDLSPTLLNWVDKSIDINEAKIMKKGTQQEYAERAREVLCRLYDAYTGLCRYYNSLEATKKNLNALDLLGSINKEIGKINKETNHFMLSKTPMLLKNMMRGEDASFVLERIGTQLRHIMIDEFQDTSNMQWSNFSPLVDELTSGGNTDRSALLIGDIKQSIYRWRGGNWNIMNQKAADGQIESLDTNFRSKRVVTTFNNAFFEEANHIIGEDNHWTKGAKQIYEGAKVATPANAKFDNGYVRLCMINKAEKGKSGTTGSTSDSNDAIKSTNFALMDLFTQINKLHREGKVNYSDMCILVRSNTEANKIIEFHQGNQNDEAVKDIKLISDESFKLGSSTDVQLLMNALKVIDDPTNNTAEAAIYQAVTESSAIPEGILSKRLSWWKEMEGVRLNDLKQLPLYELIEKLMVCLGLNHSTQSIYLSTLLDLTLKYLDDHTANLSDYLTYWDEVLQNKAISAGTPNGVHIQTIHKSKGLQAHTILIPFCSWELGLKTGGTVVNTFWKKAKEAPFDAANLPVQPLDLNNNLYNSCYQEEYIEEIQERNIENFNMLYVAFTRAEANLLIWADSPSKTAIERIEKKSEPFTYQKVNELLFEVSGKLTWDAQKDEEGADGAITYTEKILGTIEPGKEKSQKEATRIGKAVDESHTIHMDFYCGKQEVKFRQSNESKEYIKSEEEQRTNDYVKEGNLLHKIYSEIASVEDTENILEGFKRGGIINEDEKQNIKAIIEKGWQNETSVQWFDKSWTLFRECAILEKDQDGNVQTHRPDRVMMNADQTETIVVDFKFGKPKEEHHTQVSRYIQLLQNMNYKNVHGYLWYVRTNQIEDINL